MPLNRLSICIVRKVAISGACEEYRSQDRLINPTEVPLGQSTSVQDCPARVAGSNKKEYVFGRHCALRARLFHQQIIESFDLHDRHDYTEACLVM